MPWGSLGKRLRIHAYTGSYLNLRYTLYFAIVVLAAGVCGFMYFEGYSLIDAWYMTIITISTVGFREVAPLSPPGKVFTSILIILNALVFAYGLSAFSAYVIQGKLFKRLHMSFIEGKIRLLMDHVILCGYGRYGREIVDHFLKHHIPFVIIESDIEKIKPLRESDKEILYIEDDATQDEVLKRAGIGKAKALISSLSMDTDNVFTVMAARQLNPGLTIISRTMESKNASKLRLAGANHIIMPEQIGGFYMASLVSKPGAVDFFSFITNDYESDIGFDEIKYENLPDHCRGIPIQELKLREHTGTNIIAHRRADGKYTVNPVPTTVLNPGGSFIVLGDVTQLAKLDDYLEQLKTSKTETS
jgi:voltage-gated potassium channel